MKQNFIDLDGLLIERECIKLGVTKKLVTFDSHVARLETEKLISLKCSDFYSIFFGDIENKGDNYKRLSKNIRYSSGEWTGEAVLLNSDSISFALFPKNLRYHNLKYFLDSQKGLLICERMQIFNNTELKPESFTQFDKLPSEVTKYLTGRYYKDHPKEFKELNAGILLPLENIWWPIGCGLGNGYSLDADCFNWASRGVLDKNINKT